MHSNTLWCAFFQSEVPMKFDRFLELIWILWPIHNSLIGAKGLFYSQKCGQHTNMQLRFRWNVLFVHAIFQELTVSEPTMSMKLCSKTRNVSTLSTLTLILSLHFSTMVHLHIISATKIGHNSKVFVVATILLNQQNGVCRWHCTNSWYGSLCYKGW